MNGFVSRLTWPYAIAASLVFVRFLACTETTAEPSTLDGGSSGEVDAGTCTLQPDGTCGGSEIGCCFERGAEVDIAHGCVTRTGVVFACVTTPRKQCVTIPVRTCYEPDVPNPTYAYLASDVSDLGGVRPCSKRVELYPPPCADAGPSE